MDYRSVDTKSIQYAPATEVRWGGWESLAQTVLTVQTPLLESLVSLDGTTNSIDLNITEEPEVTKFVQFIKDVEYNFVQQVIDQQQTWFNSNSCGVETFNSHIKETEKTIRFGCRGATLFDSRAQPCLTLPSYSRVAMLVEISHGWFWQEQWGLKMKITQAKGYGVRKRARPLFVHVEDEEMQKSITSGQPNTEKRVRHCFLEDGC